MIEHQTRQRRHHTLARRFRQNFPVRLQCSYPSGEEIELTQFLTSPPEARRMSCGHRLLSDSDLGNPWMRPNARRSTPRPPAVPAPAYRSTSRAASSAPPGPQPATPTSSLGCKRRDRTSTPVRRGRDRRPSGRSCSEKCPRSPVPAPRALAPSAPTTDETDTRPRVRRVCGRCVVEFYNERRPHQALGHRADDGLAGSDRGKGCGHDGQRFRVAHMPTAAEADAATRCVIERTPSGRVSN